jgi:hypothetical protein
MKTITSQNEIKESFELFEPNSKGAFATNRLIEGASSAMDPQEWAEYGKINGIPAKIYYIFSESEASNEDAENYPWDLEHVSKIELDETGEF